jgi:hypothetical protein
MAAARERQIVRSDEGGELVLAMEPSDQIENRFRRVPVQITGWLIGQQQLGAGDERAGQRNSLLLSARKLSGAVMSALFQSNLAQPAMRLRLGLLPGLPSQKQRHGNIFRSRKLGQQIVELPHEAGLLIAKVGSFVVR